MENSEISWCDATFNPWWGCTKVSPGCKNCYADTLSHRFGLNVWGPTAARKPMADSYWRKPITWNQKAAAAGVRRRVFCASMSDVFEGHETCQDDKSLDVLMEGRRRLWSLIMATPHLDWMLLTKRPQLVMDMVPEEWVIAGGFGRWPANVWIGTSVENQQEADRRIPELLKIPARVRFLSVEPLLGPVDLRTVKIDIYSEIAGVRYTEVDCLDRHFQHDTPFIGRVDWVIAGGESGPGARAVHPDWIRQIRDQCQAASIPFHFKQWGSHAPIPDGEEPRRGDVWVINDGTPQRGYSVQYQDWKPGDVGAAAGRWSPWAGTIMRPMHKVDAGRLIDGREWQEFPPQKLQAAP